MATAPTLATATPATLADAINAALDAGKTVQLSTYTKVWRVKASHRLAWRAQGVEMFRTGEDGAPLMLSRVKHGRPSYNCISGCKVQAFA